MTISTFSAVLSSIFLILILPLSVADMIDSIRVVVLVENGSSVITKVLVSSLLIFALTLTFPPLIPSLYLLTSAIPPVIKSGYRSNGFPNK